MKNGGSYIELQRKNGEFPFFLGTSEGVSESARMLHYHNDLEISYIKQGTGKYIINGHVYDYEAGDMFIINKDDIHLAYDDHNLVIQVIMFDPSILWTGGPSVMDYEYLSPFVEAGIKYGHKLPHDHPHMDKVISILAEIKKEDEMKLHRYDLVIKSLMLKLMAVIMRYFGLEQGQGHYKKVDSAHSRMLKYVIEYIEENLGNPICFEEIAKTLQVSVSHFYKLFKKYTGVSPMEYLIRRRICAAKDMLKSTEKRIVEIAGDCGFNSISSFNRNFASYVGVSPREYRKE